MAFLDWLCELLKPLGVAIFSFFMAFIMAALRTLKRTGRVDWIESIMCGLITIGLWSILGWLGIPQIVAVGAASTIGFMGTHFVAELIQNWKNKQ
ncbi:phage holin family protein [Acinetobacter sp. ANC 5502]